MKLRIEGSRPQPPELKRSALISMALRKIKAEHSEQKRERVNNAQNILAAATDFKDPVVVSAVIEILSGSRLVTAIEPVPEDHRLEADFLVTIGNKTRYLKLIKGDKQREEYLKKMWNVLSVRRNKLAAALNTQGVTILDISKSTELLSRFESAFQHKVSVVRPTSTFSKTSGDD